MDRDINKQKRRYQHYNPFCIEQNNGELWSINTRDYAANIYLPKVDSVRSAYANAFDFGPRDFATRGIFTPEFFTKSDLGLQRQVDSCGFAQNF